MKSNRLIDILIENAKTFKERNEIHSLNEGEVNAYSNKMIANIYKSMVDKSYIDFDDIPESKGDITKYSGFKSMMDAISILRSLIGDNKLSELDILDKAINNIIVNKNIFEKGFALKKDYIMVQYNTLVLSCVVTTSNLILTYVEYIKNVNNVSIEFVYTKKEPVFICVKNLEAFNTSISNGEFAKMNDTLIKSGSESFTGAAIVIPIVILAAIVGSIIAIRELIFYFYYSRMKVSDYLKTQSAFLEMNKNNLELNSNIDPQKRKEIMAKQSKLIEKLRKYSDKLKVDKTTTSKTVANKIKEDDSKLTLDNVKNQNNSFDGNGYQLL